MNSTIERTLSKVVRLGHKQDSGNIYCKIEVGDGRLSICGVEGPYSNGNCRGACGQIGADLAKHVDEIEPAPGWTIDLLREFFAMWDRWHLNDMRAGSQVQEDWLRDNPIPREEYAYPKSHYEVASAKLAAAGLNPDNGYLYGHEWKREELPASVIAFLASLPDTDKTPAWV